MYHKIVHNGRKARYKYLESTFRFSQLLIRGSIRGLSPNQAVCSTCPIEMNHCILNNGCKLRKKYLEIFFDFLHLVIKVLIK